MECAIDGNKCACAEEHAGTSSEILSKALVGTSMLTSNDPIVRVNRGSCGWLESEIVMRLPLFSHLGGSPRNGIQSTYQRDKDIVIGNYF